MASERSVTGRLLPAPHGLLGKLNEDPFSPEFDGRAPVEVGSAQHLHAVPLMLFVLVDEQIERAVDSREPADGPYLSQPPNNYNALNQVSEWFRDVDMLGLEL